MIKIKNLKGYLDNEEILSSDNANLYINSPAIIIQTKDDSTKYKGKMSWKVILNNTINDSRDILESKQILIKMVDIKNILVMHFVRT